tara:strand:+ start:328 stop:1149 length:822 start_codon:yes stop_codon:yes gene_type:complete
MLGLGNSLSTSGVGGATGFLIDHPNAAAAYSLRNLLSTTTRVVKVRRSNDDAEADFTATEITDGTLTTWTGSNDGFITVWYDQSGNSRDASQATAASQPKIVSSGSYIRSDLSKPTAQYDASDDLLSLASDLTLTSDLSILLVAQADNTQTYSNTLGDTDDTSHYLLVFDGYIRYKPGANVNVVNEEVNNRGANRLWSLIIDSSDELTVKRNAAAYGTSTDSAVANDFKFSCIGSNLGVNNPDNITEIIIYQTDVSSQLSAIETNINTYYSIY